MSITQTQVPVSPADRDEPVEQLIARVLGRAHKMAQALDAPDEARVILHLAHAFADELATIVPRFDRVRFIDAATTGPS